MHFNPEITPTFVLTALIAVIAWVRFSSKLDHLTEMHTRMLEGLDARVEAHENHDDKRFDDTMQRFDKVGERIEDLVKGLQRLIGRSELTIRRLPRD